MNAPPKPKRPIAVSAAKGAVFSENRLRVKGTWPSRQRPVERSQIEHGLENRTGEPQHIAEILRQMFPLMAPSKRTAKP